MRKRSLFLRSISFVIVGLLVFALTGCQTLRKKFTRKKDKQKTNEVIPVLEPIDYGLGIINPQEKYAHHYGSWAVWQKELLRAFEDEDTDKRLKYFISQILTQLESMQKWVTDGKRGGLDGVAAEYREVAQGLEKPVKLQNRSLLRSKVDRLGKRMRAEFGTDDLAETDYKMPL